MRLTRYCNPTLYQAHWLVALATPQPKPAKELACSITRTDRNNARNANRVGSPASDS